MGIKEDYVKNGYVVVDDVVNKNEINEAVDLLVKMFKLQFTSISNNLEKATKEAFASSQNKYLQTLKTFSKSLLIQKIFMNDIVVNRLREVGIKEISFPTQPVSHMTCNDLLIDKDESLGIESHQDWSSIQGSLNSVVVWIPFTNVTINDHPLQIIPGSHLGGLRSFVSKKHANVIELGKDEEKKYADVLCKAGAAVIFSTFSIHRTKSKGNGFRFAMSMRYDDLHEESFFSRGYPCAYTRSVDRKVTFFPTSKDIAKRFAS